MSAHEPPCVVVDCPACDEPDESDEYALGYRDGYHAAENSVRVRAILEREKNAAATVCDSTIAMREAEERHRRTLKVMDAEVARLTALVDALEEENEPWNKA